MSTLEQRKQEKKPYEAMTIKRYNLVCLYVHVIGLGRYSVCHIDTYHVICMAIRYISRYFHWFYSTCFKTNDILFISPIYIHRKMKDKQEYMQDLFQI